MSWLILIPILISSLMTGKMLWEIQKIIDSRMLHILLKYYSWFSGWKIHLLTAAFFSIGSGIYRKNTSYPFTVWNNHFVTIYLFSFTYPNIHFTKVFKSILVLLFPQTTFPVRDHNEYGIHVVWFLVPGCTLSQNVKMTWNENVIFVL